MIIKLTSVEVKDFIGIALGLSGTPFELEIVQVNVIAIALAQAVKEFPGYRSFEKISAIKRFRELSPRKVDALGNSTCEVGLADAKWAVENIEQALANLASFNALREGSKI